jgi:hypothetical protein
LKFKSLSLDITEGYDNYGCRNVRKAKRENDYAGGIVIKKRIEDNYVGRSWRDDPGGRSV